MCSLSCVWLFAATWTIACKAPLSMDISRKEYWSGLPFPSPGDLPDPGIGPASSALKVDSWPLRYQGRLYIISCWIYSLYVPNSWPVESWAVKRLHCCFNPLSFGVVCYTVVSNWNSECLVRVWYTPHSTSPTLINPAINKPWQIPSKRLSIFNFTYRELRSCEIFHFSATSLSKRNCIKHRV